MDAGLAERSLAVWAEDVVILDISVTGVANRKLFEILKQVFLFKRALEGLVQGLFWPKDHVEEDAWNIEQHHEQRREDLRQDVFAALFDISVRPNYQHEPEGKQVRTRQRNE